MWNKIQKIYVGQDLVRPPENWVYTKYEGSSWAYPWWTISSGGFAQWSLGSWWITASSSSTNCSMYINIEWWTKFKIQHRCRYNTGTWGWWVGCCISSTTSRTNYTAVYYSCTTYNNNQWIFGRILGTDVVAKAQYTASTNYIDEITYDGTTYTVTLYSDDNGEPWTVLFTGSATWTNPNKYLILYHEHATTPYSQTNRVKVWHVS